MAYVVYLIQAIAYSMKLAVLARLLLSWTYTDPYNPLVHFLYQVTEPILRPLRRILPTWQGIDFSPVAALVIIQLVEWLLVRLVLLR